jgi:hypothetical protein
MNSEGWSLAAIRPAWKANPPLLTHEDATLPRFGCRVFGDPASPCALFSLIVLEAPLLDKPSLVGRLKSTIVPVQIGTGTKDHF